ncbi:MAG: class I SAM-dependent methyltransferase, partial [Sedimentisphaerales bacterium]|nr:class I SAM-dependent methyltransferase [Sedimentisphaerales bacterium]
IRPGQIILDAGCGNGYMTKAFAEQLDGAGTVYALDPDEIAINGLQSETQGTMIEPFIGDITKQTKLEDASIDLMYLSTVFHGFTKNQVAGFLQEVLRLLKPNGRLAVLEIVKEETPVGPPLDIRISPEELKQTIPLHPTNLVMAGPYFYMQIFEN